MLKNDMHFCKGDVSVKVFYGQDLWPLLLYIVDHSKQHENGHSLCRMYDEFFLKISLLFEDIKKCIISYQVELGATLTND